MAIAIKSIPILKKNVAKSFVRSADNASNQKGSVNFSVQVTAAQKILEKAKLK
jgi:hypothetical protein